MAVILPDINIWLAYTVANHPHHHLVVSRWPDLDSDTLAFCRVTHLGLLRLLTTPAAMGVSVLSNVSAWKLVHQLQKEQDVFFADEPAGLDAVFETFSNGAAFSHKRWTDAFLAAFAAVSGYTMLTLDQGFKSFKGLGITVWKE